jgi:hypothetical protein
MRTIGLRGLGILALVAMLGCGESGPKFYPVQGQVKLDNGSPLKYGIMNLYGQEGESAKYSPIGYVKDGAFTIETNGKPGAPLGKYVVTIQAGTTGGDEKNPYVTEWYADGKYGNRETSGLTLEVVENPAPDRYHFQLKPHASQKK